ncbi:MAG: lysophospholipid acyltransferase family protein [Sandaracinus sp.]
MQALVYRLLVGFLRLVTRFFFRTVEVVGVDHVPASGPVMLVGNHPNSLVDPVVITTTCPRRIAFAARDGLFSMPHLKPILWALGSVPIKRRQDQASTAGAVVDNGEAFRAIHDLLAHGNAFGIFPEGVSYTEPELQPLKTGAARMALSAAAEGIPVVLVPVGLSYRRKQHFRGRVLVQYGRPLALDEAWKARWKADPREAAHALTDAFDLAMRALTINADDFDTLKVLDGVRRLYVPDTRDLSLADEAELVRRLEAHWKGKRDVPEVKAYYDDVASYLALLDALGLSDWDLRRPISRWEWTRRVLRHVVLLAVDVPLALPGLILHAPILWGATRAGEMVLERDDVRATMRMMIGVGGVAVVQLGLAALAFALDPTPLGAGRALLVLAFLVTSGMAAIRVLEKQAVVRHGLRALSRILALKGELEALRTQRDALRTRLAPLIDAHLDPSLERIVPRPELTA